MLGVAIVAQAITEQKLATASDKVWLAIYKGQNNVATRNNTPVSHRTCIRVRKLKCISFQELCYESRSFTTKIIGTRHYIMWKSQRSNTSSPQRRVRHHVCCKQRLCTYIGGFTSKHELNQTHNWLKANVHIETPCSTQTIVYLKPVTFFVQGTRHLIEAVVMWEAVVRRP